MQADGQTEEAAQLARRRSRRNDESNVFTDSSSRRAAVGIACRSRAIALRPGYMCLHDMCGHERTVQVVATATTCTSHTCRGLPAWIDLTIPRLRTRAKSRRVRPAHTADLVWPMSVPSVLCSGASACVHAHRVQASRRAGEQSVAVLAEAPVVQSAAVALFMQERGSSCMVAASAAFGSKQQTVNMQ